MKINKVHCMFEQSGTFKKELLNLGIPAEDYDILDEFGQTDHQVDLFHEIDEAYEGRESIFDNIGDMDLVLAFFPCTRFEAIIPLAFRGEQKQQESWPDEKKLEYSMKLHEELHRLYTLICKLFAISIRGGVADDRGKPTHTAALPDDVLSNKTEADRQRPAEERGLFQETDTVLVCELRAGAERDHGSD